MCGAERVNDHGADGSETLLGECLTACVRCCYIQTVHHVVDTGQASARAEESLLVQTSCREYASSRTSLVPDIATTYGLQKGIFPDHMRGCWSVHDFNGCSAMCRRAAAHNRQPGPDLHQQRVCCSQSADGSGVAGARTAAAAAATAQQTGQRDCSASVG